MRVTRGLDVYWKLTFDTWLIDCACYINGSIDGDDGSICIDSKPCPCDTKGICTCQLGYMGEKCNKCEALAYANYVIVTFSTEYWYL